MTLSMKDMLLDCAYLLHKSNFATYLNSNMSGTAPDGLSNLLLCANNVISEIATDYIPCIYTEQIAVTNGVLSPSDCTKSFLSIKRILDTQGREVKIHQQNGGIVLDNDTYTVEYCYLPAKCPLTGSVSDFPSFVTQRVVVQGIIAEYYLVNGEYEEATMWHERFNQSIQLPATKLKNIVMRGRKW